MSQLIKCPNCNKRSWSSDYWSCSDCSFSETREWVLLEKNQDYFDGGKNRGDEPALDLHYWKEEQVKLTEEMINECLPKGKYNWELDCSKYFGAYTWGETAYYENDPQEVKNFVIRNANDLIEKGTQGIHWKWHTFPNGYQTKLPLYPYYSNFEPTQSGKTEIRIANWVLATSGDYSCGGYGYFPTIPHETAHASPEVKRDLNFKWWIGWGRGDGHDTVWRSKQNEFYQKLERKGYKDKVKARFKELRKIKGEETDKYG